MVLGGGGGIRTRDTVSRIHTFQACAFSRSATPPHRVVIATRANNTRPRLDASRIRDAQQFRNQRILIIAPPAFRLRLLFPTGAYLPPVAPGLRPAFGTEPRS